MPILLLIIIAVVIYFVKKSNNRKAAQTGEDKVRLHKALEPLLPGIGSNQILYAHREDRSSYGRTVRITYYRYAVAYRDQTLYVIPLHIDKKTREIQAGQLSAFTPENLGKILLKTNEKDGSVKRIEMHLISKQGQSLLQLYLDAENLHKNRWYPVNIAQKQECEIFEQFITALSQRVAAENPDVDDLIRQNGNAGVGTIGAIISAIGAFVSLFFPPAGIVLALIGLILAVVSKLKKAKGIVALIISILCTICSAGFMWMFLTHYL